MTRLRSQLWTNEKGKRFIVLPEEDFLRLSELVEDRGLSRILREAIRSDTDEPSIPFARSETPTRHPAPGDAEQA